MQKLACRLIAPAAQSWLATTSTARVLHVFKQACNLVNPEREILSLVTPMVGPEPFAAVVELPLTARSPDEGFSDLISADEGVSVREGQLALGSLLIDTRDAALWQPRPAWERLAGQPAGLNSHLALLKRLLLSDAPSGSFAPLLVEPHSAGDPPGATFERRFLEAARGPAQALRAGILATDLDACREAAGKLAGLGSGLTPSGDDFMLGALYALWATRHPDRIVPFAEAVVASASPRTVPLSAAWLRAAGRGEAGARWHALVEALAVGDEVAIAAAAQPIIRTGHTSGADALAGFVYVLEPIVG